MTARTRRLPGDGGNDLGADEHRDPNYDAQGRRPARVIHNLWLKLGFEVLGRAITAFERYSGVLQSRTLLAAREAYRKHGFGLTGPGFDGARSVTYSITLCLVPKNSFSPIVEAS